MPDLCPHAHPIGLRTLGDRNDRWHCNGCGFTYEGPVEAIRAAEERGRQQGRAEAIADLRDRDAVVQWLAYNRLRFDESVSERELHAAYLAARTKPAEVPE